MEIYTLLSNRSTLPDEELRWGRGSSWLEYRESPTAVCSEIESWIRLQILRSWCFGNNRHDVSFGSLSFVSPRSLIGISYTALWRLMYSSSGSAWMRTVTLFRSQPHGIILGRGSADTQGLWKYGLFTGECWKQLGRNVSGMILCLACWNILDHLLRCFTYNFPGLLSTDWRAKDTTLFKLRLVLCRQMDSIHTISVIWDGHDSWSVDRYLWYLPFLRVIRARSAQYNRVSWPAFSSILNLILMSCCVFDSAV